jgi:acyl carrier protein
MRVMCEEEFADYIDLITRLREANGFLDPAKMADLWHLDPRHLNVYIESLEELFGFVSLTTSEPELERIEWDGSFSLWREIVQRFLLSREYVSNAAELTPDSIETLDSLAAVDLIETLQRRCGIEIPLHELTREDISDIDRLWNKFFAGKLL